MGSVPIRHPELRRRIRRRVQQCVVDSAADELLAGELCRKKLVADLKPVIPNCRVLLRDKAHAARRPMSRPWSKLPILKDLIHRFVAGRSSPARIIHNSLEFRRWFKENVVAERSHQRVTDNANLRAAKHRFESLTKPLQRTCLHCRSLLRTLVQIANTRDDQFANQAASFLEALAPLDMVLLSMCADASDEMLLLIRVLTTSPQMWLALRRRWRSA